MIHALSPETIGGSLLVLSAVVALGLLIGEWRIGGVRLGIAGVLFAGLLAAHLGVAPSDPILEFCREFGLILFVYMIGLQVGPGIGNALKRDGLPLNAIAASAVLAGFALSFAAHYVGGVDGPAAAGLYAGAVTNTPSLASAQQALAETAGAAGDAPKVAGMAYAAAYPFGLVGIVASMLVVKKVFRLDTAAEIDAFKRRGGAAAPLASANVEIRDPRLDGVSVRRIPGLSERRITISRVCHAGEIAVAHGDTEVSVGDVVLAVGAVDDLAAFIQSVGVRSDVDLSRVTGELGARRLVVTRRRLVGKTIQELDFLGRYGAVVTRIGRAGVEFSAQSGVRVQWGDTLLVVGKDEAIALAEAEAGNSARRLNQPQIALVFVGIAMGILVGSVPIPVPGLPAPLKLGLAGGPLLVAILMSRFGAVGPLVSYVPVSANMMLREVGIGLFLACVGLRAGGRFVETLVSGPGLTWMAWGALITVAPLLTAGLIARAAFKINYVSICGVMAGASTNPPALSFASETFQSDAPSIGYATVYPLVMILRIVTAQILVFALV